MGAMHRYAISALLLICLTSTARCNDASGNIGCLFSETLCNQENEWCYNDVAFGKCLPLYGNVHDQDLQRYSFSAEDLHILEREMQRLFLLGYRWSHTYTQCILQTVLSSVKEKSELDVTQCNAELDQDLEGALKAIEGEEVEHLDPHNLAIVRFAPSDADPHSNYADEFYYPPLEEALPPFIANNGHKDGGEGKGDKGTEGKDKEGRKEAKQKENKFGEKERVMFQEKPAKTGAKFLTPAQVLTASDAELNNMEPETAQDDYIPFLTVPEFPVEEEEQRMHPDDIVRERFALFPPAYPTFNQDNQDGSVSEKDYDYDLLFHSPYSTPPRMNPMFKRNSMSGQAFNNDIDPEEFEEIVRNIHVKPSGIRSLDLRALALMLGSLQPKDRAQVYVPGGGLFTPPKDHDNRYGYLFDAPPVPLTRDRIDPEDQITAYPPALKPQYLPRYIPQDHHSQLPELEPPQEDPKSNSPDTMHPPYIKSDYEKSDNDVNQENPDNPEGMFGNSVARFDMDNKPIYEGGYDPPGKSYERSAPMPPFHGGTGDRGQYQWMADEGPDHKSFEYRDPQYRDPQYRDPQYKDPQYKDPQYKDPFFQYRNPYPNPVPMAPHLPSDAYYGRPPNYPPYGFNSYDYKDYPDYYDYGGVDYPAMRPPSPWNFHRDERLDVKKPGPFFKSENNFAFDYTDEGAEGGDYPSPGENDWLSKMDRSQGDPFLLTKLQESQGLNKDGSKPSDGKDGKGLHQGIVPDLLLTDEGFVEAASDESRRRAIQDYPKASPQVSEKNSKGQSTEHPKGAEKEPDSYVYISISGRFQSPIEAEQLVHLILRMNGLDSRHIQNVNVQDNQVIFQLRDNAKGMTAAHVAERTEELREAIKEKTGMEITQAGVGTKTAISAIVYSSGERQMLAAAAIVCGVCAALLVAATALFFLRRHSRSKAKLQGLTAHDSEASKDYQDLCRARMAGKGDGKDPLSGGPGHAQPVGSAAGHVPSQRVSSLSKDSENGNQSPSSRSSTSSWSEEPVISNMDISTGHMVLSYMEDHLRNKDRLEQEWVALCAYEAEPCATNVASKPENTQKNRYQDIVPYDHNRVILNEHTNVSGSNYVNASSITDHDPRNPAYIATQGPLAATAADFWQLVWEQGSVVIVMLTRLTENAVALCHRYWPEEGSELYHIYEVHLVSEHIWCDDYLVRSFYLKNVRTGETRTVTQFHFLSWPESGIPASTKALLEFRRKVNKSYRGRSCPIIVHCSDGVGRTGTYCLIDMVLNRMSKGAKEIDIAATLEHIRDQRPNMVRTKVQFEFVLMSVAEEVHAILKALPQ